MAFCILPAEKLQIVFTVFISRCTDGIPEGRRFSRCFAFCSAAWFLADSQRDEERHSTSPELSPSHVLIFDLVTRVGSGSLVVSVRLGDSTDPVSSAASHSLAVESAQTCARTQTLSFATVCSSVLLSPHLSSRFAPFYGIFLSLPECDTLPPECVPCHTDMTWHRAMCKSSPCSVSACPSFFSQPEKIMMKGRSRNDGVGNKRCSAGTHTGGWWKERGTFAFSSPPVGVVSGWRSNQACTDVFTWATYGCK